MQHIGELVQSYEQAVRNGDGPFLAGKPVAQTQSALPAINYFNRPTLAQLDATHPGVRRMVDAVYAWRDRYNSACDPFNVDPPRAPSLILSGPNGVGKTHAARAIQWAQVTCPVGEDNTPMYDQARPAGRWFESGDLILKLAPTQTEWHTVEYASVGQLIGTSPFAIVDDLGGEGIIPFVRGDDQLFERQSRWFRFIDFCYDRQIPLIITTNLRVETGELAEWVGRRAWDRLNEMAPLRQMVGMWDVPSWRVKAGGRQP